MLYNTGTDIVKSTHGLVTTVRPRTFFPFSRLLLFRAEELMKRYRAM